MSLAAGFFRLGVIGKQVRCTFVERWSKARWEGDLRLPTVSVPAAQIVSYFVDIKRCGRLDAGMLSARFTRYI